MKRLFAAIILASLVLSIVPARAGILIGSLSPITTPSTNTASFQTNTAFVTLPQFTVSNNGLSISNAYTGAFRWSFDNVTFYTNASPQFNPSTTNAGSVTIAPQTVQVPIYVQMIATTNTANTSTIQIGVSSP